MVVALAGVDICQDDMVPSVTGCQAQGSDEVILGRPKIPKFIVGHGQITVRVRHGRISGESLCEKIGGGAEVALVSLLGALDREALGHVELLAGWFLIGETDRAIGNGNAQLAGKEREMAQDFFTQRVEIRFVLNAK